MLLHPHWLLLELIVNKSLLFPLAQLLDIVSKFPSSVFPHELLIVRSSFTSLSVLLHPQEFRLFPFLRWLSNSFSLFINLQIKQLGTNKLTQFFGIDKDLSTKAKEDIYKIVIAAEELSKTKTGALIVIERDIKIQDIIATGIPMDAEVSPQLLVNIFVPKTPLHDGAVVISGNKIAAAACVLPLADDNDIAKELGTRHRAAIGISKESDSIVVVVSEETGKISVAKDGTLIADVREDVLKKILISNVVTKRFAIEKKERKNRLKKLKEKMKIEKKEEK